MADWKDNLDEKLRQSDEDKHRYTITLPQAASREFFALYRHLEKDASDLNVKYEHTKGRITVRKNDDGVIAVDRDDWPSYHYELNLSKDGKEVVITCQSQRSASDSNWSRPVVLKTALDDRNDVHFYRDGKEILFEKIAEMIFMPILTGKDFE